MFKKGRVYYEKDLQDRGRLRKLREQDGAGCPENGGRQERGGELHDPENDGGISGRSQAGRSYARSPEKLQESGR